MSQVTVISGVERRRPWSDEQKRAIVEAAFAPGAKVAQVAAMSDLRPSQIYRWRRDLAWPTAELMPVVVTGDRGPSIGSAVFLVEFKDATVRVMADAPASLVSAALRALHR